MTVRIAIQALQGKGNPLELMDVLGADFCREVWLRCFLNEGFHSKTPAAQQKIDLFFKESLPPRCRRTSLPKSAQLVDF